MPNETELTYNATRLIPGRWRNVYKTPNGTIFLGNLSFATKAEAEAIIYKGSLIANDYVMTIMEKLDDGR